MWLKARMQPPVSGILSPSIHVREAIIDSTGLTIDEPTANAHPRGSCNFLTRSLTMTGFQMMTHSVRSHYVALVPMKPPAVAKSRMTLMPAIRQALAQAFGEDTMAALRGTLLVDQIVVVRDEPQAGNLNAQLRHAAEQAYAEWPDLRPLAIVADLPGLRSAELSAALDLVPDEQPAFVADSSGRGTTAYTAVIESFDPQFGVDSAARHRADGAVELEGDWPGLRSDVDTVADLDALTRGYVGPSTSRTMAFLLPGSRATDNT